MVIKGYIHNNNDDWNLVYTSYVLLILSALMISACVSKLILNPQVIAVLTGLCSGILVSYTPLRDSMIDIRLEPALLLQFYYPIVILKFCYSMDAVMFLKSLPQILYYVLLKAIIGSAFRLLMNLNKNLGILQLYNPLYIALYLGVMYTSNDIPDFALKADRMKYLETLLIGDGIIGSSLAISTVQALTMLTIDNLSIYQFIAVFTRLTIVSVIIGLILAIPLSFAFRYFHNDSLNGITYIIFATYACFFFLRNVIQTSGMLGCLVIVYFFNKNRTHLSEASDKYFQHMINMFYYNISTIVYFTTSFLMFASAIPFELKPIGRGIVELGANAIIKAIILLTLYPFMKNGQYEFNANVIFATIWGGRWGPAQLYGCIMIGRHTNMHANEFHKYHRKKSYVIFLIVNVLQASSFGFVLKNLGFLDMSQARKGNIKETALQIDKLRYHHLSAIKMDRTYNEANWTLIYQLTDVRALTEIQTKDMINVNMFTRVISCNKCSNSVSFEADANDLDEVISEVRVRILKALKVSFVRQFEQGYLDNAEIKILLQSVDKAMNSEDLSLQYQDLKKYHNLRQNRRATRCKFLRLDLNQQNIPKTRFRRTCYRLIIKKYFERFYLIINIMCVLAALVQICFKHYTIAERISTIVVDTIFQVIFLCEIIVKILSCSDKTVLAGFFNYIRVGANVISFALFMCCCADFIMYTVYTVSRIVDDYILGFYIQLMRITRLFRLLIIIVFFSSQIEAFFTKYNQQKIIHSFSVSLAMVRGLNEILDILPNLTESNRLLQIVKTKIDTDKLMIIKDFGLAEVALPHTSVRVKTKQAVLISLKAMSYAINDLKSSGLVDDYEYHKLINSLEERLQTFTTVKSAMVVPKNMLYEMPWIQSDISLFRYIYGNVDTRIWKAGDTIVRVGEMIQGIFIIVTGMFKMSYVPSVQLLETMQKNGLLPIKDYIRNTKYFEQEESYLMVGNSIGELCLMTKRPYNVTITAFAPSQAFVVPQEVVEKAINMNRDPINGLQSRMWLDILANIIKSILRLNPMYQSMPFDDLNNMLDRAFVPNLVCFKIFVITEFIQDVLLVEGLVSDYNTGDIYTAPCYIPRTTQKITMGDLDNISYQPILVIIPLPDLDEYEVMDYSEGQSELISNHDSDCMLHVKHYHSERRNWSRKKSCRLKVKTSASPSISLQYSSAGKLFSTIAGNSMTGNSSAGYSLNEILDDPSGNESATSTTKRSSWHNL